MKKHTAAFAVAAILVSILMLGACASPDADAGKTPDATEAVTEAPAETAAPAETPAATEAAPEAPASDEADGVLSSFTALDLDENTVSDAILGGYSLTMVNIWATYCSPCINEMPDLAKLSEDYAGRGVQIIGIVSDAVDSSTVERARGLVEQTKAYYPHLIPGEDTINALINSTSVVPTTIFVDSTGHQIGDAYLGSRSYDAWAAIIDELILMTGGDPGETGGCATADPDGVVMPGG